MRCEETADVRPLPRPSSELFLFYVLRYWLYSEPIPLIHKPQKYEFTLPDIPK